MKPRIRWVIDLGDLIETQVRVETREGVLRHGVLSEVRWTTLSINEVEVQLPHQIILDGEDYIPFEQIKLLTQVAD